MHSCWQKLTDWKSLQELELRIAFYTISRVWSGGKIQQSPTTGNRQDLRSPTIIQLSLLRQHSPLAEASEQVAILESQDEHALPTFAATLAENELEPLEADGIDVLQVNVGKLCNQTCRHCHVDAGPDRRESMSRKTAEAVIRVLRESDIGTLDITGGAPEMNSNFNWIVEQARQLGRHVIDRCNLTILVAPGYESLPEFMGAPSS